MDDYLSRSLEEYLVVVDEGGISRAANKLGLTQSAVSRQMASLEEQTGVPLLVRSSQGAVPTEAGEQLYAALRDARSLVSRAFESIRRSDEAPADHLLIGLDRDRGSVICTKAIPRFREAYKNIAVDICSMDDRDVISGQVNADADVIEAPRLYGLLSKGYGFQPCMTDHFVIMVPPGHRFADRDSVQLSDLKGETIVLYPEGSTEQPIEGFNEDLYNANGIKSLSPSTPVSAVELVSSGWLAPCLSRYSAWMCPMVAVEVDWPTTTEVGLLVKKGSVHGWTFARFAHEVMQEEQ